MTVSPDAPHFRHDRGNWVRLRTLILLRWAAIVGQLGAIGAAWAVYDLILPVSLCLMAVGASILANLVAIFIFPQNKRLSEIEAMLTLLFDLGQLALLLYLTGGLTNPFALLVLAPVIISASALDLRSTVFLAATAVALVTFLALFNVPVRLADGTVLVVPSIIASGFWISLVIGIVFLAAYSWRVASEIASMSDALFATQGALAREQKLTDLGGVVAAAAHELGTPLATIKLVSAEMIEELAAFPDLKEDAQLIRDQADRCRDILRSMGRAGKDDLHLRQAPFGAVLREAAEPHMDRGKQVILTLRPLAGAPDRQPQVQRRPEAIHGLRNLVQNAVDFAKTRVWIDGEWSAEGLSVRIVDDGPGFPAHLIGRIGDPFVRLRRSESDMTSRPEYEGMGLGLFIAKTLLERTGADLTFANATDPFMDPSERPERSGALVVVRWPMATLTAPLAGALGENRPFDPAA